MPMKLYVYSHKGYREFTLPEGESNYTLLLSKKEFMSSGDIEIFLSQEDEAWHFSQCSKYIVYHNDNPYLERRIKTNNIYKIEMINKESVYLFAVQLQSIVKKYEKYDITNLNQITIGSLQSNTIQYQHLALISRKHAKIEKFNNGIIVEDLSSNGVFINGKREEGRKFVEFGGRIHIFGLDMIFLGKVLAVAVIDSEEYEVKKKLVKYYEEMPVISQEKIEIDNQEEFFNRAPRSNVKKENIVVNIKSRPRVEVDIDYNRYLSTNGEKEVLAILLVGILAVVVCYSQNIRYMPLFVSMAMVLISVVYIITRMYSKNKLSEMIKHDMDKEARSKRLYEKYLKEREEYIQEKCDKIRSYEEDRYKSAEMYVKYTKESSDLWNRNVKHTDFLKYRIGTGNVLSNIEIVLPDRAEFANEQKLYSEMLKLKRDYRVLKNMPMCIDISKENIIGLVSENKKKGAYELLNVFMTQIAANNCYTEVKIALAYDEREVDLEYYKWLPHIWSHNEKFRYIANNKKSAKELFNKLYDVLTKKRTTEYFVLFITEVKWLEGTPLYNLIYDGNCAGLSVIFVAEYCQQIPHICQLILQNDNCFKGVLNVNTQKRTTIKFDSLSDDKTEIFVKNLSAIRVAQVNKYKHIPSRCTFLEMYKASTPEELDILNRWKDNNAADNLLLSLGKSSREKTFKLDVHEKYHGPHGLIAGTTGSGKSELLQTFILSLAINYSPEEVSFLLIDYKGGSMANELKGLPHIVGSISNLSEKLVKRALITIKGEVKRRQDIFNKYGVTNITSFIKEQKCGEIKEILPYLFIIIDEFAQLKSKEPEFIKELISISQLGRSLGINLILATQRPSGVVDDNIWSNSRYRICLRVQDEQDSNEVLHRPDAANITKVGRGYVQVGNNEIFEEIQTAYCKEIYDSSLVMDKNKACLVEFNGKTNDFKVGKRLKKKEQLKLKLIEQLIVMLIDINAKEENFIYSNEIKEANFEIVINKLYDEIAKSDIEYERSYINSEKLCNMVGLFILVDKSVYKTIKEQASEVIRMGIEKNIILPELKYHTELEAIISCTKEIAENNHYKTMGNLWLDELESVISLETLEERRSNIKTSIEINKDNIKNNRKDYFSVNVGIYDDPFNHQKDIYSINLVDVGNIIVYGDIMSGKSTFLQTYIYSLLRSYKKEDLSLYAIDCNSGMLGGFECAESVKEVCVFGKTDNEESILDEVIYNIEQRKNSYVGNDLVKSWKECSSNKYNIGEQNEEPNNIKNHEIKEPIIILFIDDLAKLCDSNLGKYERKITTILKEGASVGVYLIATAINVGGAGISTRIASYFQSVICMHLQEKYEYMQNLRYSGDIVVPKGNTPGRGIAVINDNVLEFQTALCFGEINDARRMEKIKEIFIEKDGVVVEDIDIDSIDEVIVEDIDIDSIIDEIQEEIKGMDAEK